MTSSNTRQREINGKAWRVYKLIKANRDEEAEQALRGFGRDSVRVANALIAEDYLLTNGILRYLLIVVLPVILAAILYSNWDIEAGFDIGIVASVICAGFALACCIVGAMARVVIAVFRDQYRPHRSDKHPARRAGKIGCRFLTDAQVSTTDLVGALLTATGHFSLHEPVERNAIDQALTRLLEEAGAELLFELSREQRDALHYRFMMIADLVESVGCSRIPAPRSGAGSRSDASALLGVAILQAYEYLTLSTNLYSQLYRVRKVSAIDTTNLPLEWQQFVAAAKHTLPIMQRSLKNRDGRHDLLRGSDGGFGNRRELLRVCDVNAVLEAEELVRAVE